jgi:hypothetical protein
MCVPRTLKPPGPDISSSGKRDERPLLLTTLVSPNPNAEDDTPCCGTTNADCVHFFELALLSSCVIAGELEGRPNVAGNAVTATRERARPVVVQFLFTVTILRLSLGGGIGKRDNRPPNTTREMSGRV